MDETPSSWGEGSGRGREKRREDWRRRAVGELMALDILSGGVELVLQSRFDQWLGDVEDVVGDFHLKVFQKRDIDAKTEAQA